MEKDIKILIKAYFSNIDIHTDDFLIHKIECDDIIKFIEKELNNQKENIVKYIEQDQKKLKVNCKCGTKLDHSWEGTSVCPVLRNFLDEPHDSEEYEKIDKKHSRGSSNDLSLWEYIEILKKKIWKK